MAESSLIQIKGIRDGLLVTLGEAAWPVAQRALLERIEAQPEFFKGARLSLDVGAQALRTAELTALRDQLSERGITLWAVVSTSPVTETTAQLLGLATRLFKPSPSREAPSRTSSRAFPVAKGIDDETALWVGKTLRSGTRIEFDGHVVVLGDVNPGAEIIAGGSIIVWGRLRGFVHAGARGNRQAVICALDLAPTQLRVADEIAVPPRRHGKPQPEMVRLKDGLLQAEPWPGSEK
ncbi:MAG: septum site-determining protein MinC [Anaerolineales bacterium]|nr:septum site-determining protein MinC [Anaerolineales bacterium]MCX7754895.1 septum site-determining protein MinC [Anaerolineales bacterium]MDW8278986.1 septum site-determining protein MinC [Anaerolineales bacterium]